MKKSLLLSLTGIFILSLGILFAQNVSTTLSIVEKMKAASHDFTLTSELNQGQDGLKSGPLSGKKTGGIVTAEEYNRILELISGEVRQVVSGNLDIVDATSGWSAWANGTTKTASCPNGYRGVFGLSHYYDTNNGVQYHGVGTCNWNTDRTQCSSVNADAGITEGAIQVACIKGGGGSGSGIGGTRMFYHCTNAQSLDQNNIPCYSASRNNGSGDQKYRAINCDSPGTQGVESGTALFFENNQWKIWEHSNAGEYKSACTDGTLLVADLNIMTSGGGGSGSSSGSSILPGWPDAIVCTASDERNVIFYNSGENANGTEVIYFTRFSSAPGWFMRFNPDKSFKTGEAKFDCNGQSMQQLIAANKTFNFVGGGGTTSGGGGGPSNNCRWVTDDQGCVTAASPGLVSCADDEYVKKVRTHQVCHIAQSTYKTKSDLYCCKFGQ